MNNNQIYLNRANFSLQSSTYVSCRQYLSKQCILRAQIGFSNATLAINRALVKNSIS